MWDRDSAWLFDVFAGFYAWFTANAAWRASCRELATHLPSHARVVVDLGCGPGVSTIEMARQRPDAFYVGVDRAPRMLREAHRRARRSPVRWVLADAGALPFASERLDAVTGHSFLYLLGEPSRSRVLPEMRRVLRPGGRVVLMEPSARPATLRRVLSVSTDPRHLISTALWRPFSWLHVRYTPTSLEATLRQVGFVHVETAEVLGGLGVLAWGEK
ncbi:MAG TPA: methyltransferase domain-containing protein [Chloroflexota bacterium]|jgi:ubiquinone/menaquinone biosynthesis C-methylase UbiE|nr:methyltransferase domain-containing protein [Chloroflexota bacterium]